MHSTAGPSFWHYWCLLLITASPRSLQEPLSWVTTFISTLMQKLWETLWNNSMMWALLRGTRPEVVLSFTTSCCCVYSYFPLHITCWTWTLPCLCYTSCSLVHIPASPAGSCISFEFIKMFHIKVCKAKTIYVLTVSSLIFLPPDLRVKLACPLLLFFSHWWCNWES